MRVAAEPFLVEFNTNKGVRDVMLRFTQAYIASLSVVDAAGLEKKSCERFAVIRDEYDRLLGPAIEQAGN